MTLRTAATFVALALALGAAPSAGQLMAFDATLRPTCTDGLPWTYWLLNQSSATDCDMTAGGAAEALCCCKDGAVAACTVSGAGVSVIDSKTTPTTVTNSVAETTVYSYTIPAGTLSATGSLSLILRNEYLNNSGANRTPVFKVKLGGATVINATSGPLGPSALNRIFDLYVRVSALGATNSQKVTMYGLIPAASGAVGTVTTGTGMATTIITSLNWSSGLTALTQDMTASAVLEVTVTHPTTTATQTWTTYAGTLELLNP